MRLIHLIPYIGIFFLDEVTNKHIKQLLIAYQLVSCAFLFWVVILFSFTFLMN